MSAASGATLTGQAIGSPSFMPPEQCDSTRGPVGPSGDIYSLGAILYQMVSGRPPFVAGTVAETLRLVTTADPIPPRELNPTVPEELETIAMKCLEKDPARRYASAIDLERELGRWLGNRPILARPVGS